MSSSGGVGTFGLLGVVFVALKLTGVIDWSWWLVTLPFWFGFAIIAAVFFGALAWVWINDILARRRRNTYKKKS